jgi:hypothetical protein
MPTHSITVDHVTKTWDVARLWRLAQALPVFELPLKALEHYLDRDCWFGGKTVTTKMVAEHYKKIEQADLSYPIILNEAGGLMDGTHRLVKAWILGHESIRAVKFEKTPQPDIVQ